MATHLRSLSSLMANHLRLPTYLIPKTAIFLYLVVHLYLSFIVELFLLLISFLTYYLPVAFFGWLARSKHRLIYLYCGFCLFSLWLPYEFNGRLNLHSYLVLQVVLVILLTCIVLWRSSDYLHLYLVLQVVLEILAILLTCIVRRSSSDSHVDSNIDSQIVQYIFNEDNQLSVSRNYELKRDCSHLTSDSQRLEKRRRILVAEVDGEPISGYETPIIESDKPFVSNGELSNHTAQTEDFFDLQEDPLTEIFKKLPAFHDFAILSTVCKALRSVCLNLKWSLYPPHPWSIHFQDQNILNRLDDGRYVLERWEIHGRYYYGCVNGWILNIGSANIHIFNLFSRAQTNLPILNPVSYLPITKPNDWYHYIEKFILFKACHGDNLQFLVVALFGPRGFIAFTGPQFQDWICIQSDDIAHCRDVVLFQGRFYALCGRGKLVLCAFDRSNPCVSLVSQEPAGLFRADRCYLVKNVDHHIAVFQYGNVGFGGKRFGTVTFRIYKSDDLMNWTHIREPICLEGRALFISNGNSWTIDPAEVESCRTDSIYFVDDYWFSNNRNGHFIGVFDIANETIEDFQFEKDQYPPNDLSPFSLTYNEGA